MVRPVSDADFADVVLGATGPVLVDFHADWCGPCRQLEPVLAELAAELRWLGFTRLDVDQSPVTPAVYRVSGMPTLLVFRRGEPVLTIVGARPKRVLSRMLEPLVTVAP